MDKVIGYIRVSTLTQVKGHSLDFQQNAIIKYCEQNDLELVKPFYIDRAKSGKGKRPKFEKMMKRATNDKNIAGVIVNDFTRFGRSTMDLLSNIYSLDGIGKKFISVREKIDISDKMGRLMLTMLSGIADFERDTIIERLEEGKLYAQEFGTKSGKPMHRPRKEINWDRVRLLREKKISWNQTAKSVDVSTPTLISRAKEEGIE